MKKLTVLSFFSIILIGISGCSETKKTDQKSSPIEQSEEKPIQHLNLPDITSRERAITVMDSTTTLLKTKTKLDAKELNEIHIITYSLEKAVAYFATNTAGEQKQTAERIAEVVEEVHLNSENNRAEKTKLALDEYYELEEGFNRD